MKRISSNYLVFAYPALFYYPVGFPIVIQSPGGYRMVKLKKISLFYTRKIIYQ